MHLLVHRVQPIMDLAEKLQVWLFRKIALRLRKRNFDFQLFPERQIDRKHLARFLPLQLTRALRSVGSGDVQRCHRFVHAWFTQSQRP